MRDTLYPYPYGIFIKFQGSLTDEFLTVLSNEAHLYTKDLFDDLQRPHCIVPTAPVQAETLEPSHILQCAPPSTEPILQSSNAQQQFLSLVNVQQNFGMEQTIIIT